MILLPTPDKDESHGMNRKVRCGTSRRDDGDDDEYADGYGDDYGDGG